MTKILTNDVGLRERKKKETFQTIYETATAMMLENGFENVSTSDIAIAANVSKMTVFNYFPTKEDIILCQIQDHTDEASRVVRTRSPSEQPIDALRRHFVERIAAADPAYGVNGDQWVLAFTRLIVETPSLMLRFTVQQLHAQQGLADALAEVPGTDEIAAAVAAAQIINVQRTLVGRNLTRLLDGVDQIKVRQTAIVETERAFDLLERGLIHTNSPSQSPDDMQPADSPDC